MAQIGVGEALAAFRFESERLLPFQFHGSGFEMAKPLVGYLNHDEAEDRQWQ
jgi:hypothetical protein